MTTKKSATKKKTAPQPNAFSVTNCTFTNNPPSEGQIMAAKAIADAANENAKALQAAAAMLKGPNSLLHIGQ